MTLLNSWTEILNYFGGPVIFALRASLLSLPFDFSVDSFTAFAHIYRGDLFEGILTCLIVILTGIVFTVGFLWSKTDRKFIMADARKSGTSWMIMLFFPPGLLPFVFTKLRLNYINELKTYDEEKLKEGDVQEKLDKWKDLNLKANWCEAVFEGKYQSLLQIIILLEPGTTFNSFLDYFPILTTIKETYSHTSGVYKLADDHFERANGRKDPTPLMSRIYGFSYNSISILAPALCINGTLQWLDIYSESSDSFLNKFIATIGAFALYYILFSGVYLFSLIMSNIIQKIPFYIIFHWTTLLLYTGCLYFWLSISLERCRVLGWRGRVWVWGGRGDLLVTCSRNVYYIVIPIFTCLAILTIITSYLSREFAQFALQILNDKINERWSRIKSFGYSIIT